MSRLALRPIESGDEPFLLAVYGSTRQVELQQTNWDDAAKAAFVEMQFRAQDAHYRRTYPDAEFHVILVDDRPAGRLYVNRGVTDLRIIDITVLPAYQRGGVGTALVQALLKDAAARRVSASIHVEKDNPARHWYDRLGFREAGDVGVYQLMKWSAEPQDGASAC